MAFSGFVDRIQSNRQNLAIAVLAILILFFGSYAITGYVIDNGEEEPAPAPEIKTFSDNGGDGCYEDGKPVIRLFSTTWCPHCKWITETYESVVQEYADKELIVAKHWELDINDDTLTQGVEGSVPESELAIYREFNPRGSIPTFVFGCKYSRIGNGFERSVGLEAEEAEFRAVIDTLIQNAP